MSKPPTDDLAELILAVLATHSSYRNNLPRHPPERCRKCRVLARWDISAVRKWAEKTAALEDA